jgi:hypothetical protein
MAAQDLMCLVYEEGKAITYDTSKAKETARCECLNNVVQSNLDSSAGSRKLNEKLMGKDSDESVLLTSFMVGQFNDGEMLAQIKSSNTL